MRAGGAMRCKYYEPIDIGGKYNCGNCQKWNGKKCRDEAQLLAEWDAKHRAYERMMAENKGVRVE